MRHVVFVLCLVGVLGGCAVGNSHRYDLGDADLKIESAKSVAVAVVDLRPYVLSGEKEPRFSGLFRGGFGNPFDVTTNSGRSLAEDLSQSVVTALKRSGVDAVTVAVASKTGTAEARALVLASGADRCALLQIREWKSDTYFNTGLTYDMALDLLAGDGTLLASKEMQGHDNLGPSGVPGDARVQVEKAVKEKLEALFANPDIQAAIE